MAPNISLLTHTIGRGGFSGPFTGFAQYMDASYKWAASALNSHSGVGLKGSGKRKSSQLAELEVQLLVVHCVRRKKWSEVWIYLIYLYFGPVVNGLAGCSEPRKEQE